MNKQEKQVKQLLETHKITFTSTYVGIVNKDSWECYKFICILGGESFDFHKGLAHGATFEELRRLEQKTGCFDARTKWLASKGMSKTKNQGEFKFLSCGGIVLLPNAAELLYSLILDSDLACESFEDFCCFLGYDKDSIEALELYLQCQEQGNKLRRIIPSSVLEEVKSILEDY